MNVAVAVAVAVQAKLTALSKYPKPSVPTPPDDVFSNHQVADYNDLYTSDPER